MKKLYLIVLVFQLLILCSCSKPLPQGASVQGQDILEAANLEAEKSTVGLDSNEPDLSVSESVIPERTEQQADAVNQSVPSDEEIVDATADCETALAEENNGNAPEVPAVTETEMRLHQAVMQVYTGQPEVDNDALAAIAHYLEVHPSVGELYLPFDDFGISIYALDGTGNSQYVLFRKKRLQCFICSIHPRKAFVQLTVPHCKKMPSVRQKSIRWSMMHRPVLPTNLSTMIYAVQMSKRLPLRTISTRHKLQLKRISQQIGGNLLGTTQNRCGQRLALRLIIL